MKYNDSFIYNEFVKSLLKSAQQAVPTTEDSAASRGKSLNDHAKEMIANLEVQNSGFTSDTDGTSLRTSNLTNLDKLFLFLSENNIKRGGFPIVVRSGNEAKFQTFSEQDRAKYSNFPDVDENPDYYIHKSLLIEYLQDLLAQNDPLLNVLIKQRIIEANSKLKLDFKPKAVPAKITEEQSKDKASSFFKENEGSKEEGQSSNSQQSASKTRSGILTALNTLPLAVNDINFTRISSFFAAYANLLNADIRTNDGGNVAEAKRLMASASISMKQASANTKNNKSIFSAQSTPDQFKGIVKDPQSTYYLGLVHNLQDVVRDTSDVVANFLARYGVQLEGNTDEVKQQIEGNSIYQSNWNNLALLERDFTGK